MSQSTPTQHEIDVYAGEYVLTGDKSKSWRKTFPNSKAKPAAVAVSANRMHNSPNVLLRIDELRVRTAQNDVEEFDVSASELKRILFEAITEAKKMHPDRDGNMRPHALPVVVSAAGEISKMNGYHAAEKREHSGAVEVTRVERVIVDTKD